MTLEEAQKLAKIIETADNHCPFCIEELTEQLNKEFTDFDWHVENGKITVAETRNMIGY